MLRSSLLLLLFCWLPVACQAAYTGAPADEFAAVATLDDVTNGLQNNASRGLDSSGTTRPAANPMAGAFFDDGNEGDMQARTENYFAEGKQPQDPAAAPAAARRMLIYHGQLTLEVKQPDEAIAAFLGQVANWGGFLQSQAGHTIVVRLPAARFDEAFLLLRGSGRVLDEMRKADDVTEEFVDLQIRIDTAKKARDRLLAVLQDAKEIKDVLAVEKELRRLDEEIERMEGRQKFLADRVALATLQVAYQATATAPPPPKKRRRTPSRFSWINEVGAERVMEGF
jgi:hypothetical protein